MILYSLLIITWEESTFRSIKIHYVKLYKMNQLFLMKVLVIIY